ncbi:hypothetical protein OK016_15265 [Vibrio chagasii]|nr:hypothetical protein [Vibrio chagasii]
MIDTMTREEVAIRSAKISEEMLMRGFTTIRDVTTGNTLGLKKSIDNGGYATGPRNSPFNGGNFKPAVTQITAKTKLKRRLANGHEDSPIQ